MSVNKVLVVYAHGSAYGLCAQCEDEAVKEQVGGDEFGDFSLTACGVDYDVCKADGVYVGEVTLEDLPGTRGVAPVLGGLRPVTKEEWRRHCDGEWPWAVPEPDPVEK